MEADAEDGRKLLQACSEREDRDAKAELFYDWMRDQLGIKRKVAKDIFSKLIQAEAHDRALRLLNTSISGHNPVGDTIARVAVSSLVLFVFLGVLGGVVYLFRSCV